MNSYQREQVQALSIVRVHLASLPASEVKRLYLEIADYLAFRSEVDDFFQGHFNDICNEKCYQSNMSACCARESIITFFGDVVINVLMSSDREIEALVSVLQQPNKGFKCVYLSGQGCRWRVKPIVCEMFLCRQAKEDVLGDNPPSRYKWKKLKKHEKRFTWPDRPVLFDDLERYFIEAGYHSPLMYMHKSPGLLRVKRDAKKGKLNITC
jgi:hypothetical protein